MSKKKKRKKKKLPRSGCARRRHRQRHVRYAVLIVMHLEMCSFWLTTGP